LGLALWFLDKPALTVVGLVGRGCRDDVAGVG
jgi:hypothetical protein